MKPYPLIWLVLSASAIAQSDVARTPAERPRLTQEMRRRASEAASSPTKAADATALSSAEEPVAMEPVQVTGTYVPPTRRPEDEDPESQPFTWKNGGTILKQEGPLFTTQLKCQYNPRLRGWEILKLSW